MSTYTHTYTSIYTSTLQCFIHIYTGIYTSPLQCFIYMPCSTTRLHAHIYTGIYTSPLTVLHIHAVLDHTSTYTHTVYTLSPPHFYWNYWVYTYIDTSTQISMLYIPLRKDTRHAHILYLAMGQEPGPRPYQEESLVHAASGNR